RRERSGEGVVTSLTVTTRPEEETADAGRELARTLGSGSIVLLSGELGAGKTAFVRGIAEGLGIDPAEVTSPTFTLVQEYRGGRLPLHHVDLYRLGPAEVDDLVVDVALAEAGQGDANELRVAPQLGQRRAAAVTHARAQTAHELVHHGRDAAFVSDPAFDAFRHELLGGLRPRAVEVELVLKVPIAAAAAHRADRAHAAVLLEAASLIQNHLARALVGAREQIADHRRARADRERLGDVARVADAAVGDDRDVVRLGRPRALHDRGDHRH